MSDTEIGLFSALVLILSVLAFLLGKKITVNTPVVPKPSKEQLEAEARAKEFADKALAIKEESQKLAGAERDEAIARYQRALHEGAVALIDDTDALNAYMKQVGDDIRGR